LPGSPFWGTASDLFEIAWSAADDSAGSSPCAAAGSTLELLKQSIVLKIPGMRCALQRPGDTIVKCEE
jgi:hypothetical protein